MKNNASSLIQNRVDELFVTGKYNCTMTALSVFAELEGIPLSQQAIDAAQMMPGAGGVGDLCGFISGSLMFIGVWGGYNNVPRADLRQMSMRLSQSVQERFGSLHCRDLRNDCAILAVQYLNFAAQILVEEIGKLMTLYKSLK
jgi:C_GCAxxG_C_C family probable redox protein